MVQINFAKREVQCKVVFYGPARSGKTANLRAIHERTPEHVRGALTTIATDTDRTLFFDFLPLNLGLVAGVGTKINLYAVPYIAGQNATRLLVLEGIDGIVFVADSSRSMLKENIEALENLRGNVEDLGRDLADIPIVFQYNKSDAPDAITEAELAAELNPQGHPAFSATADTGVGVFTCLKAVTQGVLVHVSRVMAAQQAPPAPAPQPAPVAASTPVAIHVHRPEPAPEPVRPPEPEPEAVPEPVVHTDWHEEPDHADMAEAQTDEFEEVKPVRVMRAEEPEPDRATAEYEAAFGPGPAAAEEASFEPPAAVREAAQSLAQPGNYDLEPPSPPAPPATMRPQPHAWRAPGAEPPASQTPAQPLGGGARMVSVGGPSSGAAPRRPYRSSPSWEQEQAREQEATFHRRPTSPVVDRRKRHRSADNNNVVPTANIVAGAICALVSLIAIGYLVLALL